MANKGALLGGGAGCGVFGVIMIIVGLMSMNEAPRFEPFYTQLKCTNIHVALPLNPTTFFNVTTSPLGIPLPTVVGLENMEAVMNNGTLVNVLANKTVTVAADATTGLLLGAPYTGPLAAPNMHGPPTQAAFDAAGHVPVSISCNNENSYDIEILEETNGLVEAYDPVHGFIPIGSTKKIGTTKIKGGETGTSQIGMKLMMASPLVAALEATFEANLTVPLFFSLSTLKTNVHVSVLGMTETKSDMVPPKYCAQMVDRVVQPIPGFAEPLTWLQTGSPTVCRNSQTELLGVVGDPAWVSANTKATHAGKARIPTAENQVQADTFIDNLDPLAADLTAAEDELKGGLTMFMILGFGLGVICILCAVGLVVKGISAEEGSPTSKKGLKESP